MHNRFVPLLILGVFIGIIAVSFLIWRQDVTYETYAELVQPQNLRNPELYEHLKDKLLMCGGLTKEVIRMINDICPSYAHTLLAECEGGAPKIVSCLSMEFDG